MSDTILDTPSDAAANRLQSSGPGSVSSALLGMKKGGLFGKSAAPSIAIEGEVTAKEDEAAPSNNNGEQGRNGDSQQVVAVVPSELPEDSEKPSEKQEEEANGSKTEERDELNSSDSLGPEAGDNAEDISATEPSIQDSVEPAEGEEAVELPEDKKSPTKGEVEEVESDQKEEETEEAEKESDNLGEKKADGEGEKETEAEADEGIKTEEENAEETKDKRAEEETGEAEKPKEGGEGETVDEPMEEVEEEPMVKKIISMDTDKDQNAEEDEEPKEPEVKLTPRRGRPPKSAKSSAKKEKEEEKAAEEDESGSSRRSSLRGRKTEQSSPAKRASGRGRRSKAVEEDEEMEKEEEEETEEEHKEEGMEEEEEEEVKTPTRGRRSLKSESSTTSSARGRRKAQKEEDEEEDEEVAATATPKRGGRAVEKTEEEPGEKKPMRGRPSGVTSAASTPVTSSPAAATPATPGTPGVKRGRGRPPKVVAVIKAEKEGEEEAEAVEVTPARGRGRKSGASKANSVKKGKAMEEGEEDPYDLDTELDKHPEPLQNITMEKGAFGEVKYTRTPSSAKYEKTEQSASSRVGALSSTPLGSAHRTLSSLMTNRKSLGGTPAPKGSAVSTPRRRSSKKEVTEEENEEAEETMDFEESEIISPKTPGRPRGRKRKTEDSAGGSPAKKASPTIDIPTLDPEKQWAADHPEDEHAHLVPGARVFAAYQKTFYPALVGERDGMGRYMVRFIEDDVVRPVPPAGIIPLSAVVAEKECTVAGEEEGGSVKVIRSPNAANASEWQLGIFHVMQSDGEEERKLAWTSLQLEMHDWKKYVNQKSAQATKVTTDNIASVGERRERRSRALDLNAIAQQTPPRTRTPRGTKAAAAVASSTVSPAEAPSASPAAPAAATPTVVESAEKSPRKGRGRSKKAVESPPPPLEEKPEDTEEVPVPEKEEKARDGRIFLGKTFILTSANRTGGDDSVGFRKNEMKKSILERGGVVVDDISAVALSADAYLISDTHYRTHKYLAAMARAMPCVSHKWVVDCVAQETLLDHEPFLLSGGQALLDGAIYPLPRQRGILLKGRRVMVHSKNEPGNKKSMSFMQIWEPIVDLLGADVVKAKDPLPKDVDILLTDSSASAELVAAMQAAGVPVVSSEWLIQAIIMSTCPAFDAHPRFRYDCGNEAKPTS